MSELHNLEWHELIARVEELEAENERLRAAFIPLLREARGMCWMTGANEFMGNTNQACLSRRIEQAEAALQETDD